MGKFCSADAPETRAARGYHARRKPRSVAPVRTGLEALSRIYIYSASLPSPTAHGASVYETTVPVDHSLGRAQGSTFPSRARHHRRPCRAEAGDTHGSWCIERLVDDSDDYDDDDDSVAPCVSRKEYTQVVISAVGGSSPRGGRVPFAVLARPCVRAIEEPEWCTRADGYRLPFYVIL